jgi:hypothetical protein
MGFLGIYNGWSSFENQRITTLQRNIKSYRLIVHTKDHKTWDLELLLSQIRRFAHSVYQ